ncbi:MAG: amidase [Anaerolineales bacterium]|jgi:aspartyl-tRNA(Asn)/glutamyl-tRNA(Gln) amidotransferase subunit A
MKPDISNLNLSIALEQLRHREYTALELTEACLRQIARLNPAFQAFIYPVPDLAVQAAMQADVFYNNRSFDRGEFPLLGVPLGLKDLVNIAGVPTTAGSKFFKENLPDEDASIVSKLKHSGVVLMGKTNLHEIALGVTGVNPHYGVVKNPWDTSRISGGSSSGSAVAVSLGMCLAAIGTDTGGSIRIPAALCGVVGLKPTYGRVSSFGVFPLSWNLDHVGPLTRTARDAASVLSVIAGYDPQDPASINIPVDNFLVHLEDGVNGWRVAVAKGDYIEAADAEVLVAINQAAQVFTYLGAEMKEVDLSWLEQLALANSLMTQADGAAFHRERLAQHPDWFGPDVLQRLQTGAAFTSSDYASARRSQAEGRRRFELFFEEFDLLLLPTTPISAPLIEGTGAINAARQLTRFTSPFNLTGLPALSIPCGFTKTGLPVGLQIISKHWGEAMILQAGYAFEQATGWWRHHPAG